jgi:hypothetical protein
MYAPQQRAANIRSIVWNQNIQKPMKKEFIAEKYTLAPAPAIGGIRRYVVDERHSLRIRFICHGVPG